MHSLKASIRTNEGTAVLNVASSFGAVDLASQKKRITKMDMIAKEAIAKTHWLFY
jgi:hypothetical protein